MPADRSLFVRSTRRQALRLVAGGGSAAGLGAAWLPLAAQTQGTLDLMRAPRVALVVGNGQYVNAPVLKNAPNDARGIARALSALGFAVTRRIDVNRRDLLAAIRDFTQTVEAARCVALFYFAGHGLQIAWHNYLLPVDAEIDKADDVAKQGVDLDSLLKRLAKAGNAMNLIVLDACRENPFARDFRGRGQGLSQMDAPRNTLLAKGLSTLPERPRDSPNSRQQGANRSRSGSYGEDSQRRWRLFGEITLRAGPPRGARRRCALVACRRHAASRTPSLAPRGGPARALR